MYLNTLLQIKKLRVYPFAMKKFILIFLCLFSFTIVDTFAQTTSIATDSEEYNRWSMSLYGGYIYGERDRGLQIFASRFNVVSDPSYAFGGDLRYALNSFWSIEGGYRYSTLEGSGFETTLHTASIKTSLNLNRFYRRSSISEYVNPYIIAGVEQDFFNAEGPDDQFSRSEASLIGGAGIAFRLSDRIEIFGQHEIKLSSNHLDLTDQGYPYDQIGMSSGGVRIHFGRSDRRPMNLKPPTRQITDQEYDDIFARTQGVPGLSEQVESLENQINTIERENNEKLDELFDRITALETRVDSLEAKTDCLCERKESVVDAEAEPEAEPEPERDLRRTVPAGHYVQVYASRGYNSALQVREQFRELLSDELENLEEVFIIHRQQFYEVMIGTFDEFSNAQRMLEPSTGVMADSFIITFLRPAHLEDRYEGTVIIHD
ncbi:hypothetical protein BH23BAC3_BH23BAC3_13590 [soil metagenome]